MTALKTIVRGDRTTVELDDTEVTFGDRSSNIYKKAFELIEQHDKELNSHSKEAEVPVALVTADDKEWFDVVVDLAKFPSNKFSIGGLIHGLVLKEYKTRSDATLLDLDRVADKAMMDFYTNGTIKMLIMDPDTKHTYGSSEVKWQPSPDGRHRTGFAEIPPFSADMRLVWGSIRFFLEHGDAEIEIYSSNKERVAVTDLNEVNANTTLVMRVPLVRNRSLTVHIPPTCSDPVAVVDSVLAPHQHPSTMYAMEEITGSDESFELEAIIEDVEFEEIMKTTVSRSKRPGDRAFNRDNIIGVVRTTHNRHGGVTTTYTFVYYGDSVFLINDKGYTLDSLK